MGKLLGQIAAGDRRGLNCRAKLFLSAPQTLVMMIKDKKKKKGATRRHSVRSPQNAVRNDVTAHFALLPCSSSVFFFSDKTAEVRPVEGIMGRNSGLKLAALVRKPDRFHDFQKDGVMWRIFPLLAVLHPGRDYPFCMRHGQ